MRMGRRIALISGGSESYTFYDYIRQKYNINRPVSADAKGIRTPVFNTDVMIRTIWMPTFGSSASQDNQCFIAMKMYDADQGYEYGAGIRAAYYSRYSTKGIMYISTPHTSDIESDSAWMEGDQWYPTEIRMSLNTVSGSQNYIKVGSHQLSVNNGTEETNYPDPWFLFGFNGDSEYFNENSRMSDYIGAGALQRTYFYDYTGENLLADLKPCKRGSDGAVGMYDTVGGVFCPAKKGNTIQTMPDGDFEVGNL